jgi:hypothetical protein
MGGLEPRAAVATAPLVTPIPTCPGGSDEHLAVQSLSDRLSTMTCQEAVGFGGYPKFFHYGKGLIIRHNTILIQYDTPDS